MYTCMYRSGEFVERREVAVKALVHLPSMYVGMYVCMYLRSFDAYLYVCMYVFTFF
jgi:hypothetical protein